MKLACMIHLYAWLKINQVFGMAEYQVFFPIKSTRCLDGWVWRPRKFELHKSLFFLHFCIAYFHEANFPRHWVHYMYESCFLRSIYIQEPIMQFSVVISTFEWYEKVNYWQTFLVTDPDTKIVNASFKDKLSDSWNCCKKKPFKNFLLF